MEMADEAHKNGYNVLIINPIGAPAGFGDENDLEQCDFSNNIYIEQAIELLKKEFGENSEIYACGYSLGSNHMLRHLATHENCDKKCGIKAAFSISSPFCLYTAGIQLRRKMSGLYDWWILGTMKAPYLKRRYKVQNKENNFLMDEINSAKNLF